MSTRNRFYIKEEADALIKKKRYARARDLLIDHVLHNQNDAIPYAYLAKVSIYLGAFDEAKTYLQKALLIDSANAETLAVRAYLTLRAGNIEKALSFYMRILEDDPTNSLALQSLERMKESENIADEIETLAPELFLERDKKRERQQRKELEQEKRKRTKQDKEEEPTPAAQRETKKRPHYFLTVVFIVIVGTLAIATLLLLPHLRPYLSAIMGTRPPIIDDITNARARNTTNDEALLETLALFEEDDAANDTTRYPLKKVRALYIECKERIREGKLNQARIIINDILHANDVNAYFKTRFAQLTNHITPPDIAAFDDTLSFSTVVYGKKARYKGCFVKWKGDVSQIKKDRKAKETSFMLFAVSEDGAKKVGMTFVTLEGLYDLSQNDRVLVFGTYEGRDPGKDVDLVRGIVIQRLVR